MNEFEIDLRTAAVETLSQERTSPPGHAARPNRPSTAAVLVGVIAAYFSFGVLALVASALVSGPQLLADDEGRFRPGRRATTTGRVRSWPSPPRRGAGHGAAGTVEHLDVVGLVPREGRGGRSPGA